MLKFGLTPYLNRKQLETKSFKIVTRTSLITTKHLNFHEFTETSETECSSNKNDPQSSLENSNRTKLN